MTDEALGTPVNMNYADNYGDFTDLAHSLNVLDQDIHDAKIAMKPYKPIYNYGDWTMSQNLDMSLGGPPVKAITAAKFNDYQDPDVSYQEQRAIELAYYKNKKLGTINGGNRININRNKWLSKPVFKKKFVKKRKLIGWKKYENKAITKGKYNSKMNYLFELRKKVGRRNNPSMPRLSLSGFKERPDILDCYIKIEQWKSKGGESNRISWLPSIYIK